jgi:serine/threonine-protein kinase
MGEVYRARDLKLKREVALKVLPADVAGDRDRLARLQREAEVLASLNHPNIAQVYGVEANALVMELVEGEDLAQRIARGRIPWDDALPIAKQIVDALEAAHEAGIVHRDLKPANVKVRTDGTVKVLDFGLAKAIEPGTTGNSLVNSPTITSPAMTMRGMILGTAAYMAPEQAKGRVVDKRADIWAFGCVLFEMLTGRRAFLGEDVTDIIAEVLKSDVPLALLPPEIPGNVRRLIARCLQRDPKQRLRDIGDARMELDRPGEPDTAATPTIAQRRGGRAAIALASAAVLMLAAALALYAFQPRTVAPPETTPTRLAVTFPAGSHMHLGRPLPSLSLSPDGKRIVYTASGPEGAQLWLRDLDRFEPTPLPGTAGARMAFFSPDGKWIGYIEGGSLKKIPSSSGPPVVLCDAAGARGATWTDKDEIVFATIGQVNSGLQAVPAAGGTPRLVAKVDAWFPDALPGGNAVIANVDNPTAQMSGDLGVALIDLASGAVRRLFDGGAYPRYAASGHILFLRNNALLAAPFDPGSGTVGDARTTVVESVHLDPSVPSGNFAVSASGTLAYAPGDEELFRRTLTSIGPGGPKPIIDEQRFFAESRVSPDGRRIAATVGGWRETIMIADIDRRVLTRLTPPDRTAMEPVWSPDGRQVAHSQVVSGVPNLFLAASDGSFQMDRLTTSPNTQFADSFSPDGRWLVFTEIQPQSGADLFLLALADRSVRPLLQTSFVETNAAVSPDGRWLAYASNRSGRQEIHVSPFPSMASTVQVSFAGGNYPAWSKDGRQLHFLQGGSTIMVVDARGAPSFSASSARVAAETGNVGPGNPFDLLPDGRFLIVHGKNVASTFELRIVLNWLGELTQKVPTR